MMKEHNVALGYLQAFVILLVLAYHSALAYMVSSPSPSATLASKPYIWAALPIIDSHRWLGFNLFTEFNAQFFMPLLFFISGLFVWPSLTQKGNRKFLRDRTLRLGLPFAIVVIFLIPLAYYPSYRITGADPSFFAFWQQWISLDYWPSGPFWFLSLLLFFNFIVVMLRKFVSGWGDALGKRFSWSFRRPMLFFCVLVAVSAITYFPMLFSFGYHHWASFGPFQVQTSRVLLYAIYFTTGLAVGAYGINQGLLPRDGLLARRWPVWFVAALIFYVFDIIAFGKFYALPSSSTWQVLYGVTFILSCAASGFFFLSLFLRFVSKRRSVFDSLHNNAYGMYLIHYVFVIWLQYALLNTTFAAIEKGAIVFSGTLALSWCITAAIRRIPAVGRVISPSASHASV
jgi:surface polysaccharide O-acyltransferase-like enzyme